MQLKQIVIGCTLACAALAAQAAGVVNVNGVPHNVVYLSGATAPDGFMGDIVESMMTNVKFYQNVSANGAFQHRAYAGDAANISGVANGTKVLFMKRSKGGSVWGVNPVARAQRVETIDVNNCTSGAGTKASPFVCGTLGIDPGTDGAELPSNAGLVPDFGVADVEPALFQGPYNTENDQPALSPVEVARLQPTAVNQLMMGLVATNQVPASTVLTRAAYGAMLNNQIQTWDQVDPALSGDVAVCRRVEGSGTQTSYNWFFSNFPCQSAAKGSAAPARMSDSYGFKAGSAAELGVARNANGDPADASAEPGSVNNPWVIDPSYGYTVIENSGSGDVRNCLKNANAGADHYFRAWDSDDQKEYHFVATFSASGPMKAVGVLSLDSYNQESGWSFRTMDGAGTFNAATQTTSAGATGVAPSKANLINGRWDFAVELSMQYRTVGVSNEQGDNIAAISGVTKAVADTFILRAGDPKYVSNFDTTATYASKPNAYASLPQGYAGLSTSGGATTNGSGVRYADLYVSKYTRNANTCSPLSFVGN